MKEDGCLYYIIISIVSIAVAAVVICCTIRATVQAFADEIPDITEPCGMTEEELAEAIGGNLAAYADVFLQAERMTTEADGTCVNAVFLAAVAKLESGDGTSRLAKNKNNLFGWRGKDGWKSFSSPETSILFVADRLRKNYIDRGRTTIESIGARYCDEEWSRIIGGIYRRCYG